jgi:hypothetical protein
MNIVSIIFFSFFLSNHYKDTKILGNKNNIMTTIQTIVTEKEEICEISGDLLKHHAEKPNNSLNSLKRSEQARWL